MTLQGPPKKSLLFSFPLCGKQMFVCINFFLVFGEFIDDIDVVYRLLISYMLRFYHKNIVAEYTAVP